MSSSDFHYCGPACDPPHRGEEWPIDWEDKVRADERAKVIAKVMSELTIEELQEMYDNAIQELEDRA